VIEGIIISTLVKGGVYALLASGFSLIFGMAHIINLAHTAFFMLAGFGMFYFMGELGLGIAPAIAITVPAVTLSGILAYRFLINPIREHLASVLLITVALAMALQELLQQAFGAHYRTAPALIGGVTEILGIRVINQHLSPSGPRHRMPRLPT